MKRKPSPVPTRTTSEQQQEEWERLFATFTPAEKETVERGTKAAKAAAGSRLAVAMNLLQVRDVVCRDLTNPKQKRKWTLCLRVTLPGLATSRSQTFRDMLVVSKAKERFPASLLDEFIASGYALNVRPTAEEPLGRMTKPLLHVLEQIGDDVELNSAQCRTVLAEAANIVKKNAKESRAPRTPRSAEEKRERILHSIHEVVISSLEDLAKAIEPGDEYPARNLRDDLELIVGRLLTATGIEALDLELRSLPEGYECLNLPAPAPKPRRNATRSGGSRTQVAKAAKRKSLRTPKTVTDKGTTSVSTTVAEEEVPSLV